LTTTARLCTWGAMALRSDSPPSSNGAPRARTRVLAARAGARAVLAAQLAQGRAHRRAVARARARAPMLGPSSRATARPGPTARNGAAVERRPCAPSSPPPGEPSAVERSAATLVQLAGAIEALARAIGVFAVGIETFTRRV
jgi:hypothetical protein